MANAKKCDRCKKCFDPLDQGVFSMVKFQNPVFQTSNDIKNVTVKERLIPDHPDAWVDLCPACTLRFRKFMANKDTIKDEFELTAAQIQEFKKMTLKSIYEDDFPSDYFKNAVAGMFAYIFGMENFKEGENE